MRRLLALAGAAGSLALGACGGDDSGSGQGSGPGAPEVGSADAVSNARAKDGGASSAGRSGTEVVAADSQYGPVLFDSERRAIYYFDKERSDASECYGICAEAWPPVLTNADPEAGEDVATKLLGTTERAGASTQVTYAGHPLYYYVDDPPGEVLCHNVEEFGGSWLAVEPSGKAVQ